VATSDPVQGRERILGRLAEVGAPHAYGEPTGADAVYVMVTRPDTSFEVYAVPAERLTSAQRDAISRADGTTVSQFLLVDAIEGRAAADLAPAVRVLGWLGDEDALDSLDIVHSAEEDWAADLPDIDDVKRDFGAWSKYCGYSYTADPLEYEEVHGQLLLGRPVACAEIRISTDD
jgi:hypothetical protein